jgi:spore cortex formation protein SpoVR/YcgB (stage V sporulation)
VAHAAAAAGQGRAKKEKRRYPEEPQENLLYFIEKNAPLLEPWQREVVRIVRKVAQYFYPQRQTQVMNEGWATFWHYTLLNTMYDEGLLADGFMMESCRRTPTWCSSRRSPIRITRASTRMRSALRCSPT